MIRTFLATTAVAALISSGALAQTATDPATTPTPAPAAESAAPAVPVERADGSLASNIIGESVYNGTADDAENIGKVTDVVFDKDGNAQSVVIGVGGFLGVGAKNVTFDYAKLQWAEKNGDRWLVAPTTKDELTAQADFDATPYQPALPPAAVNDNAMAPSGTMAPDTSTAPAAPADDMAQSAPAEIVAPAEGYLASLIIGESVYNGTSDDAENIGKVNDIVLAKDGQAQSLVIGVGGFLGIGAKNVAFDYGKAQWAEKDGDRWLVVEGTKEQLKALPDFDRKAYDPAPAPAAAADADAPAVVAPATDTAQTEPATPDVAAPADGQTAEAPAATGSDAADQTQTAAIDKSTLTEMPMDDMRSQDLVGTTVYGAADVKVGEIGDVVLTPEEKADAVIVDVGGFLGMGEKEVAMGMDNLKFMTDKDGNKYLYTSFTKDQLEAQPAYDQGSYSEQRDQQRLMQ